MSETGPKNPSISVIRDGPIARVTILNRGKRNAFTWEMYDQLLQIATDLREAEGLRAVVIRGNPEDGFAAGTDIRQFLTFNTGADGVAYERRIAKVLEAVRAIPVPTIAAVERAAVGAGLALAVMCDIILAEPTAQFGAPIARTVGNCLPVAIVARLRSRLGVNRTTALLMTAALVPAEELVASGFVTTVTEPQGMDEAIEAILKRITTAAPLTLKTLKEMNRRLDDASPLPDDGDLLETCYGSADFREGTRAFLEQRRANWSGR
jgi:enoyl-CoA hydratase/carnithine racemase